MCNLCNLCRQALLHANKCLPDEWIKQEEEPYCQHVETIIRDILSLNYRYF